MRNRSESSQAFREVSVLNVSQLPEVDGCYCGSARACDSGGLVFNETRSAKGKTPKGGTKVSAGTGKDTSSGQEP